MSKPPDYYKDWPPWARFRIKDTDWGKTYYTERNPRKVWGRNWLLDAGRYVEIKTEDGGE